MALSHCWADVSDTKNTTEFDILAEKVNKT